MHTSKAFGTHAHSHTNDTGTGATTICTLQVGWKHLQRWKLTTSSARPILHSQQQRACNTVYTWSDAKHCVLITAFTSHLWGCQPTQTRSPCWGERLWTSGNALLHRTWTCRSPGWTVLWPRQAWLEAETCCGLKGWATMNMDTATLNAAAGLEGTNKLFGCVPAWTSKASRTIFSQPFLAFSLTSIRGPKWAPAGCTSYIKRQWVTKTCNLPAIGKTLFVLHPHQHPLPQQTWPACSLHKYDRLSRRKSWRKKWLEKLFLHSTLINTLLPNKLDRHIHCMNMTVLRRESWIKNSWRALAPFIVPECCSWK